MTAGMMMVTAMSTAKACRMCGRFHAYVQACDPVAQREYLSKSFAIDPSQADSAELIALAQYLLRRKNP